MNLTTVSKQRSCLLIVDAQEKLMPAIHNKAEVIDRISLMLQCATTLKMPVLVTTQYKKGLGPIVPELNQLTGNVETVDKTEFNAFANKAFRNSVKRLPQEIDSMIVTGAEAHICVFQTALGAVSAGYKTWVVSDAISSRKPEHRDQAINLMLAGGIWAGPAEMIVYQLLEQAGTEEFKLMLPYIK